MPTAKTAQLHTDADPGLFYKYNMLFNEQRGFYSFLPFAPTPHVIAALRKKLAKTEELCEQCVTLGKSQFNFLVAL